MEARVLGQDIGWPEVGRLQQVAGVLFAGFNAGYFLRYLYRHRGATAASRLGALAALFLGAVVEGAALLTLAGASSPRELLVSPGWVLAHSLTVAASGFISLSDLAQGCAMTACHGAGHRAAALAGRRALPGAWRQPRGDLPAAGHHRSLAGASRGLATPEALMTRRETVRKEGGDSLRNFYEDALTEAERLELPVAQAVDGLDQEIAVLRVRMKAALREHPEDLPLIARGLDMLVKAVAARYRLSPKARRDLADNLSALLDNLGAAFGSVKPMAGKLERAVARLGRGHRRRT